MVILAKDGAVIPHVRLVQSMTEMDWREIELMVFDAEASVAKRLLYLPEEGTLHALRLEGEGDGFVLKEEHTAPSVNPRISAARTTVTFVVVSCVMSASCRICMPTR